MDVRSVTRPTEPEEPSCKADTSNNHWRQPPLRDRNSIVGFKLLDVAALSGYHKTTGCYHANNHSEIWQAANAWIETMRLLEHNRICCQEQVKQAVDKSLRRVSRSALNSHNMRFCTERRKVVASPSRNFGGTMHWNSDPWQFQLRRGPSGGENMVTFHTGVLQWKDQEYV